MSVWISWRYEGSHECLNADLGLLIGMLFSALRSGSVVDCMGFVTFVAVTTKVRQGSLFLALAPVSYTAGIFHICEAHGRDIGFGDGSSFFLACSSNS